MAIRTLYLGTHKPHHLAHPQAVGCALFVSARSLRARRGLPRARGRWALDSGAFTEISTHGAWTISPEAYVAEVRRYRREIGRMDWAAIQDWMCEPHIIERTGLSVEEHQRRTVASYLELRRLAPEVPWLPILQGWSLEDYRAHVELYREAGVELESLPLVGIGSICRRQGTEEAVAILEALHGQGLRLHAFGMKTTGLLRGAWRFVESTDSLAWSFHERKHRTGRQNSLEAAVDWAHATRDDVYRAALREDRWVSLFSSDFAPEPDFSGLAAELEELPSQVELGLDDTEDAAIATQEATRRHLTTWRRGITRGHFKAWRTA